MSVERPRTVLLAALCSGALLAPTAAAATLRLETLLERTVLRVDAAYATVDLSARTADRVSSIRDGRACDEAMRTELERTLLAADGADFTLEFRRGIGLDRLLVRYSANWKRMMRAGMLERGFDVERESRRQRARFAFLERSGLRSGDRFFYRLRGDTVTMRFVDARGVERLDETEVGALPRRSLLAAYFLKGAELRDGLLRSACR
jgi:hypothetical protein